MILYILHLAVILLQSLFNFIICITVDLILLFIGLNDFVFILDDSTLVWLLELLHILIVLLFIEIINRVCLHENGLVSYDIIINIFRCVLVQTLLLSHLGIVFDMTIHPVVIVLVEEKLVMLNPVSLVLDPVLFVLVGVLLDQLVLVQAASFHLLMTINAWRFIAHAFVLVITFLVITDFLK